MILKILDGKTVQWRETRGVWIEVGDGKLKIYPFEDPLDPGTRWVLPADDSVSVYLMNKDGKTVDVIWPMNDYYWVELEDGSIARPGDKKAVEEARLRDSQSPSPA